MAFGESMECKAYITVKNKPLINIRARYAISDVAHLLQDMGQPQHTRNDAHASLRQSRG